MKFRKKPVVIDAWRFPGDSTFTAPQWLTDALNEGRAFWQGGLHPYITIPTLEGEMKATAGDWIIRGVEGELYPCKPSVFKATYEAAE